jgi:hypothetical protein
MITVQQLANVFDNALQQKSYRDKLTVADIHFISCFDNDVVVLAITNALNLVLDGNELNRFKIPTLVKLIFIICRQFYNNVPIKDVNIANVIQFVLIAILDANILGIDELEKLIIIEIIESSIFLLTTEMPVIKKKWLSCMG